jgi:hypothetical protein
MRDPHVRFCERHGGVIPRAYSTPTVVAAPAPASFGVWSMGISEMILPRLRV